MAAQKQKKTKTANTDSGKNITGTQQDDTASWSVAGAKIFFQEVFSEFGKIVWPNKKVTAGLTCFVLVLVIFISIFLGSVDLLLGKLVTAILNFGMM